LKNVSKTINVSTNKASHSEFTFQLFLI